MSTFKKFYLFSALGIFLLSIYPLFMGVKIVIDMIKDGTVLGENYPKYIIPYTPISLAIIVGVLMLPLIIKFAKKYALLVASGLSVGIFFLTEFLFESKVIVTTTITTTLESWQMYMCYVPPEGHQTRTWTAVDVLIGEYSPAFKIHFYLISIVLILSFLNCFYGFAHIINSGNKQRLKPLILQSISTVIFLGLCILACFTAFFRDGEITVSALSALLMSLFFTLFGVTMGIYVGSFLLGKKKLLSIIVPAIVSSAITSVMYVGEMILLSGNLYRFGTGFMFYELGSIGFAPIDILIILLSGAVTAVLMVLLNKSKKSNTL